MASQMLKHASESGMTERPEISQLIQRLSADGRRWAEAEVNLAKAELGLLKGQAVKVAAFSILAFAATFCALVALTQAGIAFLTPYVDNAGVAGIIVFALLLAIAAVSVLIIRSAFSWKTESIFFRWFTSRTDTEEPSK